MIIESCIRVILSVNSIRFECIDIQYIYYTYIYIHLAKKPDPLDPSFSVLMSDLFKIRDSLSTLC